MRSHVIKLGSEISELDLVHSLANIAEARHLSTSNELSLLALRYVHACTPSATERIQDAFSS
jgi:hypothetical protein